MSGTQPVRLGVVGPAHGLTGEVLVHPDADLAEALVPGLRCRRADGEPLEVAEVRTHKGRTVVRFADVTDRDRAEGLRGTELLVDRADVDEPDVVWVDALLGADAVDDHGELIGLVERVDDGPAHDWLVVARPDGGELLIPLVAELVDVDVDGGRVTVRSMPGLVDDAWA